MSLEIPFRLRGFDGVVVVEVRACSSPEQSGLTLLEDDLPADTGVGLPLCTATVAYPGLGYGAAMAGFNWSAPATGTIRIVSNRTRSPCSST